MHVTWGTAPLDIHTRNKAASSYSPLKQHRQHSTHAHTRPHSASAALPLPAANTRRSSRNSEHEDGARRLEGGMMDQDGGGALHLRVAAEQWVPWLRITKNQDTGSLTYSGIMHNILLALSSTMNFTYELRRPPDGLWGVGYPNGTWVGQLGMVKRGEVDFALGPFAFNWERYHYACEFTQPIFIDYESVFMRRPRIETDLFAFVRPFTWEVWLCLLGALALIWLALVLLLHLTPSAQGEQRETRNTRRSHLVWVVRTLASQSNPWMPLSGSRRVVTAAWLLACLIFLSSFSSTLTAMLTVPLVRLPIDSMEDLVGQTAIPWAIESGGFLYQILYTATDGLYKTIWDGHSARITDCYTFRQDIGDGKYAAICDKMTMKKVMSEDFSVRGECNYYMAREDFKAMPLALAFQHHHPFYSQANQRILELVNKGLVDRWIQEQLPNGTACLSPPGSDLVGAKRPLSLKDYYGLFSMFGICMLAWSLVLCVEVVLAAASSRSYRSFHSHLLARITKKNSYTNSTGSLSK
ncbi:glutamate receptor ionotropic, delta-2-like isoform X2 [Scylla paramamosain]|uniref:glutamate receptor ionotropic, delta-2-like isoform X2 n=1 Tax=Scylla paramamosain TaxID=85552 RepID=UPI0030830074